MNELTIGSGDEASPSIGTLMGNLEEDPIYWGLWGKDVEENSGDGRLSPQGPVGEPVESVDWVF